jgi:hypothetical protein
MRRGAWHQFGDRSQRLVLEQLQGSVGVGAIISARDLTLSNAADYAQQYRALGADVLIDHQFYVPDFSNTKLASYPTNQFRDSISRLNQVNAQQLTGLAQAIDSIHTSIPTDGIIAPAAVYEAGRPDIVDLNARLFETAKTVGDAKGLPTYATVVLGRSATSSDSTLAGILGWATALDAAGWYFGYEFSAGRLPSAYDEVYRCCGAALTLACTGKPVLHAYAGPVGLLSLGCGCTGVGVGHSQNLWGFTRERWEPPTNQGGGGGDAPPRFFSTALWGTIVYPDELVRLPSGIASQVLTQSPYSAGSVTASGTLQWGRWDANKHLIDRVCQTVGTIAANSSPRQNAQSAATILQQAVSLHGRIAGTGLVLRDETGAYQNAWLRAIGQVQSSRSSDYDYLDLIS